MLSLAFLLLISIHLGESHYYKAHTGMRQLFKADKKLGKQFLNYYKRETERLDRLEKYLERLGQPEGNKTRNEHADEVVGNPVDAYLLIKRFVKKWKNKKYLKSFERKAYFSSAMERYKIFMENTNGFDNNVELRGSIYSIIKLQETYLINVTHFANGFNNHSQILSSLDIFIIGYYSMMMQYFHIAKLWLQEAYNRYVASGEDETMFAPHKPAVLMHAMAWSSFKCGDIEKATSFTERQLQLDPGNEKLRQDLAWYRNQGQEYTKESIYAKYNINSDDMGLEKIGDFTNRPWLTRLNRMCRGEESLREKDRKRLYCTYYRPTYRFYLKPLQLEVAYDDPDVVFFHNLLSEREVDILISKSREKLATAEVFSRKSGKLITAEYRLSKNAWFPRDHDNTVKEIYGRVGDLTNLEMEYCEPLQVANYGIGGNYESHYDHATPPHNSSIFGHYDWGNRLATMLIYLTDVETGGDTVFVTTAPGVQVAPKKGAGVFWYNLKRNGQSDDKTKHGGCPVLSGEKWIANLWIHEFGNEFRRPCTLHPDE